MRFQVCLGIFTDLVECLALGVVDYLEGTGSRGPGLDVSKVYKVRAERYAGA